MNSRAIGVGTAARHLAHFDFLLPPWFSGRSLCRTPADCRRTCLMPRNLSFGKFCLAIESR